MTSKECTEYVQGKLEEIRRDLFAEFGELGMLHIAVDYGYISAFSTSKFETGKKIVDFNKHFNADGTDRFGKGEE